MKTATIVYIKNGKSHTVKIEYQEMHDLLYRVFNFEVINNYEVGIQKVEDHRNKINLGWSSAAAHVCFSKGRITENQLYETLKNENYSGYFKNPKKSDECIINPSNF